jgi:hypothetical protein
MNAKLSVVTSAILPHDACLPNLSLLKDREREALLPSDTTTPFDVANVFFCTSGPCYPHKGRQR